jgi:hypothetical protein
MSDAAVDAIESPTLGETDPFNDVNVIRKNYLQPSKDCNRVKFDWIVILYLLHNVSSNHNRVKAAAVHSQNKGIN